MTTEKIVFRVNAIPRAQPRQRHRFVQPKGKAGFVMNYTPKNHPVQDFKAAVQMAARAQYEGPPLQGPILLRVSYVFPRPKGMFWKTRPMPREWHTKKPELDNVTKAVQDALNKLLYVDDAQICRLEASKLTANGEEPPHVIVEVEEFA